MAKKILRINMTDLKASYEDVPEKWARWGGRGLTSAITVDEVEPTCHPLGPNNKLVIAPGWVTGSPAAPARGVCAVEFRPAPLRSVEASRWARRPLRPQMSTRPSRSERRARTALAPPRRLFRTAERASEAIGASAQAEACGPGASVGRPAVAPCPESKWRARGRARCPVAPPGTQQGPRRPRRSGPKGR